MRMSDYVFFSINLDTYLGHTKSSKKEVLVLQHRNMVAIFQHKMFNDNKIEEKILQV